MRYRSNELVLRVMVSGDWWFRKVGTAGTPASQAEIGVWVQAPGALLWGSGSITPGNILRLYMQNPSTKVQFWPKNGSQCRQECVLKHFNNGNAGPMRSGSFSTLRTAFPRVLPRNDPWLGLGSNCVQVV